MTRETLGEIALNRQDNEKDVPFFTPESEGISDGEESVHPALKDAESIVCEGQEAMWVEDDFNEIFRRTSSKEKPMSKKKNKFNLFLGKRKINQKAVVLLPPQPLNREDFENQENQLTPENNQAGIDSLEEIQEPEKDDEARLAHGEVGVKESNRGADEPQMEVASTNEQEKEDDVDDVVHGSIDIPDQILEEMKLQVEDAVERARRDLDSEGSDSNSQLSSFGFTTDSLDFEEEYGVEMNIPSSGKAVEIVGTGPMLLETETIERTDEADHVSEGKKSKWGLLRIFKSKPKQQKVSPRSSDGAVSEKIETPAEEEEEERGDDNSPNPEVGEQKPFSPKPLDSSNHEPDRYSVAAPKAALVDDMDESDSFSDDEEDALDSTHQSVEDEDDDFDDRYRIGPPKMSKSEIYDDASTASVEQEIIPNRAEDREPALSLEIDCREETTVVGKTEQSGENADDADEPQIDDQSPELVDEVDETNHETNNLIDQEGETDMTLSQLTKQDDKTEKRKSRFVGIFGRRKMNKKSNKTTSRGKKAPKAKESPKLDSDEVSKHRPGDSLKYIEEPNHPEPSPVASMKGDSMTVIANAVSKGALKAVESNLETEGNLKSRRIRTRADSSKDVIDLIRERTQNNSKRQDPLDSSDTEVQMSMSKDPSGKAMFEQEREKKEAKSLMHLAPTPRAKKVVEKVEEEQEQPCEISHQLQITQRLYGTPKGNGRLLATKKVYIGDLLQGASTDPTVDSAFSDEKEINEVKAAN